MGLHVLFVCVFVFLMFGSSLKSYSYLKKKDSFAES